MLVFEVSQKISASPDVVWRHLTEPALMGVWMFGDEKSVRSVNEEALERGSLIVFKARGAERKSEVIEFEERERIALHSAQGSISATYVYDLVPERSGSFVTLKASCDAYGMGKLVAPIVRPLMRAADGKQLEALKKAVESAAKAG